MKFKEFIQPPDYKTFRKALAAVCEDRHLELKTIGAVGPRDLYAVTVNPKASRTVCFVAGVHGDEVAGPLAVLEFLGKAKIPNNLRVLALPLVNPIGFDEKTRNAGNVNINRQFGGKKPTHEAGLIYDFLSAEKIDFLHSLHEDDGADGFYLYYQDKAIKSHCEKILQVVSSSMPLESRKVIYEDPVEQKGLIFVEKTKAARHAESLECWMFRRGANYICTETPTNVAMEKRVDCHVAVMKYVIKWPLTQ